MFHRRSKLGNLRILRAQRLLAGVLLLFAAVRLLRPALALETQLNDWGATQIALHTQDHRSHHPAVRLISEWSAVEAAPARFHTPLVAQSLLAGARFTVPLAGAAEAHPLRL